MLTYTYSLILLICKIILLRSFISSIMSKLYIESYILHKIFKIMFTKEDWPRFKILKISTYIKHIFPLEHQ